ncbi:hypothetical protein K8I61_13935 [bacterium]|nr:hypothetical protein [bacterium]
MQIARLRLDTPIPYVPAFGGERERAARGDLDVLTFHLRPMTVAEYDELGELFRESREDDGRIALTLDPEVARRVLARHVVGIENLDAGGEAVTDGSALADLRERVSASCAPLFLEVLAAIRDISTLSEGERKNC